MMKKILSLLICLVILISCTQSKNNSQTEKINIVIDLKKIAGKNISEVEKILGKAEKVEPFSESSTPCNDQPCEKAYYQKDKFEIIFINGKADWITINELSEYDFNEDNIELFGISNSEPDFNNPDDLIRWKNIENISEINIFNNGSNKISYAYIRVATE